MCVALESAAPLGVHLGGQCVTPAAASSVAASADRTLPASTCWISRTAGAAARACAAATANTAATAPRREHLPRPLGSRPRGAARSGAAAAAAYPGSR